MDTGKIKQPASPGPKNRLDLESLQRFYRTAVEFYVTPASVNENGLLTPQAIRPITANIDLRQMLGSLAALRRQGVTNLLIGGPNPLAFSELPKLIAGARKLGMNVAVRIVPEEIREHDPRLLAMLAGLDHILLVCYVEPGSKGALLNAIQQYQKLSALDCQVWPLFIGDESLGEQIMPAMDDFAVCGAEAFLLGFPLAGIAREANRHFVSANETRARLVHAKYAWRNTGKAVGLFAFPLCALSYGEPIPEPLIPLAPVFNPFDAALYDPKPTPRLNYFSPDGRLGCMCPLMEDCPRMHKQSVSLGPDGHFPGIPDDYFQSNPDDPHSSVLRVTFSCNQSCRFCFIQHSQHEPSLDELVERIKNVRAEVLTFSGGEPGLVPFLPQLVKIAKQNGARQIVLQTNAVLYSAKRKAAEVIEAGVDQAFISLHAHMAKLSDRLTNFSGSFEKTLLGIDNLLELPQGVRLNIVIQQQNYRLLVDYVDWICARFEGGIATGKLSLNMAFVGVYGSTDWRENLELVRRDVPRLCELKPYLQEAVNRCFERGLVVSGFETACGFPRCLLDNDARVFSCSRAMEPELGFVKGPQCATCRVNAECYGVRESYAAAYGTDELIPIK